MNLLSVRDRVTTSHDASTTWTSRVLTVASLQRLKMEALIPAPADCEVGAQRHSTSVVPVCGHTRLDGQHISCRSSAGRCLIIIHLIARTSHPVNSIFSYTSRNSCLVMPAFSKWQRDGDECHTVVPIPGGRLLQHRIQKLVPRYDKCLNSGGEYVEK